MKIILIILVIIAGIGTFYFISNRTPENGGLPSTPSQQSSMQQPPAFPE